MQEKIGIISDIHDNSFALQAVLEDLGKNYFNSVLNLDDPVVFGLDSMNRLHVERVAQDKIDALFFA